MSKTLVEMAADIIQAQSSSKAMSTEEVTLALQNTFKTLQNLQHNESRMQGDDAAIGASHVGIAPEKSILKNKIICLECGQEFKMLSPKHLASHGLTGREYRKKYGFKLRQPLCAKALSANRKKAGKARGIPDNLKKAIAARTKKSTVKKTKKTVAKKAAVKKAAPAKSKKTKSRAKKK